MEIPEQTDANRVRIWQQVERIAREEEEEGESFDDLVRTLGWAACHDCLIDILLDDNAGETLWVTSASLLMMSIQDKLPVDENLLIGLAYKRFPPGSSEHNLAWSITVELKRLDYTFSDYDPRTDPEVTTALSEHTKKPRPKYRPFLARLFDRCSLVALVKVRKVPFWNRNLIRVEYLEIFKGTRPETGDVHVLTMWGKDGRNWYKKGEQSVLFALSSDVVISQGRVGRMPLIEIDGETFAESFASSIVDLAGVDPIHSNGRLLVKWSVLRAFLLEQRSRGKAD